MSPSNEISFLVETLTLMFQTEHLDVLLFKKSSVQIFVCLCSCKNFLLEDPYKLMIPHTQSMTWQQLVPLPYCSIAAAESPAFSPLGNLVPPPLPAHSLTWPVSVNSPQSEDHGSRQHG